MPPANLLSPTSDVLDAYRADLTNAGCSEFSEADAAWLQFGTLLQRAVALPVERRAAYLRSGAAAIAGESAPSPVIAAIAALADLAATSDAICASVLQVAAAAEDAGAFAVATAMLDSTRVLVGIGDARLQGRLLAQQARICRKIGELDVALELCDAIEDLGETHDDVELRMRAQLGKGIVARMRGNYPESRRRFTAILQSPESTDALRELHAHAHHGLMVAEGVAGEFESALRHGRNALDRATNDTYRAELLSNLATVCLELGQFRAALNGYLRALAGTTLPRVRLTIFGSAAVAAARLGDRHTVDGLADAALRLVPRIGHEYEVADMLREVGDAYGYLGVEDRAARFHADALERARRGEFFEIIHRLENPSAAPAVRPAESQLAPDAQDVATELASGNSDELLVAALSSDLPDSSIRYG